MNTPKYTTDERLEFIEKLLFLATPFRKLPPDMQERAAELFPPTEARITTPRVDMVHNLFGKIINLNKSQREDARFPKALNPPLTKEEVKSGKGHGPLIKAAPLSLLINRCKQRKDFAMKAGDISQINNIMNAIKKSGLIITTLHDAGIQEGSEVKIVLTREAAIERNVPGYRSASSKKDVVESEDDDLEDDDLVLAELAAKRDESREEIVAALSKAEATPAPKIAVWDDSEEITPEELSEDIGTKLNNYEKAFRQKNFSDNLIDQIVKKVSFDAAAFDEEPEEEPTDEELEDFQQEQAETFEESEAASAISFDREAWESDEDEAHNPVGAVKKEPDEEVDLLTDEHGDAGEWNDFEDEGDQPEHHPFVDFDLAGEQAPKKVGVFVRKP